MLFSYPLHLYVFVLICQYYVVLLERMNKDIIYIYIYSVIDVECVSNRSKDINIINLKVCRWFLLNNKIFTFHDLFTFTESIA